ncbi:hypothetical protein AS593_18625 [Caulobacter vibrioides]|nr:hypothetical protein AS593_18625 [Caulobacter vibrioides]
MLITSLAAAGVLGLSTPAAPQPSPLPAEAAPRRSALKVKTKAYNLGGWEMRIERDGFTGQARCRLYLSRTLRGPRISYADGVFGFHMGDKVDVADAWYRIDNGPPRAWRDDLPALATRGEPLATNDLFNPTGGVVLIARDKLAGAGTVTIRSDRGSAPRRFRMKGFEAALAAARYNGCASQDGKGETFQRDALRR